MRDERTALKLCHYCPKLCRSVCPVADAEQNETTTPWAKMSVMKLVDDGKMPMNRETMALAYKCLNCRASEETCELDNPVAPVLDAHRNRAFQSGLAPEAIHQFAQKFQKQNNPYGRDLAGKLSKLFPEKILPKARRAYFAGCTEIHESPETIGKTFSLFERLGVEEIGLFSEPIQCCGYPLFAAGDWENFREIAEVMANTFRDTSLIISGSPICLYTIGTLYRSAGFPVRARLQHTTEFLQPLIAQLPKSGLKKAANAAYHDPCYLGRYRSTYDAPREILEKIDGKPPAEFFRNRENSYCCGGGGLLPVSSPETADQITTNRLEEYAATGADLLVTACPTCVDRFKKVSRKNKVRITVKNLIDYLEERLNGKG